MITHSIKICYVDFSNLFISPSKSSCPAYSAPKIDYGFDRDEDALGRQFLAPLPANNADNLTPAISADEFDTLYNWFIA